MTLSTTQTVVRGSTVQFMTTFYDANNAVTQPGSATINILYPDQADGSPTPVQVPMTSPVSPAVAWTAQWDTRMAGPGSVAWSIHSDPGPPFAVEDGNFTLTANAANLAAFT